MSADGYEWDEPSATEPTGSAVDEAGLQPLAYPNLLAWFEGLLSPMYRRHVDGRATTWCPEWWNQAEALTRLEAIWRAWGHLRLDPTTGISVWFTSHADPNMAALLDPAGPFAGCTAERGHRPQNLAPLPHTEPPSGLF